MAERKGDHVENETVHLDQDKKNRHKKHWKGNEAMLYFTSVVD